MKVDPDDLELQTLRGLLDLDSAPAGLRVLEAGAGDGRLSFPLLTGAALWAALDPDRDELRLAAQDDRARARPALALVQSDARRLPFSSCAFDLVFFTHALC